MGPGKVDFERAIFAGFVATAILAILMYAAPLAGLPLTMDCAGITSE